MNDFITVLGWTLKLVLILVGIALAVLITLLPVFVWQIREIGVRCERLLQQIAGHRANAPARAGAIPGPAGLAAYRQDVLTAAGLARPSADQEQVIREAFAERLSPLEAAERLAAD